MEAKIDTTNQDLDAFSQGGPAMQTPTAITDLHALLVTRADTLEGCTEASPEEAELAALADAIEAYEAVRRPHRCTVGGSSAVAGHAGARGRRRGIGALSICRLRANVGRRGSFPAPAAPHWRRPLRTPIDDALRACSPWTHVPNSSGQRFESFGTLCAQNVQAFVLVGPPNLVTRLNTRTPTPGAQPSAS